MVLSSLESIIDFPVIRPDVSLITIPSYDEQTQLYYAHVRTLHYLAYPEHPIDDNIVTALVLINEVFGQLPFENLAQLC